MYKDIEKILNCDGPETFSVTKFLQNGGTLEVKYDGALFIKAFYDDGDQKRILYSKKISDKELLGEDV